MLHYLEAGLNILWSAIDIFYLDNTLPHSRVPKHDRYDNLIQFEATEHQRAESVDVNSGFYYARSQPSMIAMFAAMSSTQMRLQTRSSPRSLMSCAAVARGP